jgi:hypothetical protein
LRRQRFDDIHLKAAFDHGFDAVLAYSGSGRRPARLSKLNGAAS